jgi:hypothetical protein
MMINLAFYFQLSVAILIRKQQSKITLTAAEKWGSCKKRFKEKRFG